MANWPTITRAKLVLWLSLVATTSLVAWFVMAQWGRSALIAVAVVALAGVAFYRWQQRIRDARATRVWAESGSLSFADTVVRMRVRQQAADLIASTRRARIREARVTTP